MVKILWDWNGTLLNDVEASYQCIRALQKQHGITPLANVEAYREIFGFPIQDYYEKAGFDFSKLSWSETGQQFMADWLSRYPDIPLNEQAIAALMQAKQAGYACYILSATQVDLLKAQVTAHPRLENLIDGVYGIGDIYASSKEGAAREFQAACLDWDQIYMVGDTLHDLEVAKAIGARCILYDGGHQARAVLEKQNAEVVCSLKEALERIEENAGSHD